MATITTTFSGFQTAITGVWLYTINRSGMVEKVCGGFENFGGGGIVIERVFALDPTPT